jgi:hypothetical protein
MSTETPQQTYAHPARLIIALAIASAIGLGICRFTYPAQTKVMGSTTHPQAKLGIT